MRTPRLSVVVPTCDRAEALAALLERLARQSLPADEFELVVVDDGSRRPLALDPAAQPFPLRVLHQPNAGPGAARNRAFAVCRAPLEAVQEDVELGYRLGRSASYFRAAGRGPRRRADAPARRERPGVLLRRDEAR